MAQENFPDRVNHVFKLIRDMRGGKDYDSTWGKRMKGTGPYAWMIGRRFEAACAKLGLNKEKVTLTTEHFRPPRPQRSSSACSDPAGYFACFFSCALSRCSTSTSTIALRR